jgi:hypothetical protein
MGEFDPTNLEELEIKYRLWTSYAVDARLRATFALQDIPDASVLLSALVGEIPGADPDASDPGAYRLMLDAIKLSEGDLRRLAMWIEVARSDPRDLVAAAEYRRELSDPTPQSRQADLAEYILWLSDTMTPPS